MNKDEIKKCVVECFINMFHLNYSQICFDELIKDYYGIDSIEVIEFIVALESDMGIEFDDEMLVDNNLDTLQAIIDIVQKSSNL